MWKLLGAKERVGIELTESLAMLPAASVSGLYFSNPKSIYFGTGKITEEQVRNELSYNLSSTLFLTSVNLLILRLKTIRKGKVWTRSLWKNG
jgi:hypothetical protein